MGVPALFRWLSKKYPKIIEPVVEETPRTVPGPNGQDEELPPDMSGPNPNGTEFDCLYLDMNGIVHPCTHPEGKPAPETEEEMMVEVFAYTERVVNMVRPRRLLMMAIDGVAPRAKMNQQRSRRFRSAKEAKEKEEEKAAALAEWKAMGLAVTDGTMSNKKAWDSNAITPGTPFMDLLAASLRYWIAHKLNTDPGWKNLQVIISDASVPGEGEHKIMEHIRRQRSHAEHDPNTRHVIYGLDADLIMLSLATHEPYFKVLREDVFAQDSKPRGCHNCGKEGHIAANCKNPPQEKDPNKAAEKPEKKPFIFLDVSTLREYLEVELNMPGLPFAFDLERAIDDWVFLIFFVGNDFLPHLPSLEIREGAIDTLLRIWKKELGRMGGYLTNHGKVELAHAQLILDGLAAEEDDIFRKRKEMEERQESNRRRRQEEDERRQRGKNGDGFQHGDSTYVPSGPAKKVAAVEKPAFNGLTTDEAKAQANSNAKSYDPRRKAVVLGGDNNDVVRNRAAVRQANIDAAAALKAELASTDKPEEPSAKKAKLEGGQAAESSSNDTAAKVPESEDSAAAATEQTEAPGASDGSGKKRKADELTQDESASASNGDESQAKKEEDQDADGEADGPEDAEDDDEDNETVDPVSTKKLKVNPDGMVEYEDNVKLWEPGYRERYYREKFGVDLSDDEFRKDVVKSYVEGLCWVLAYYYQGVPSWQWYYPYHFSPFAADFQDLAKLDIKFTLGQPFKPFEQLMGVLPAASRASIPKAFQSLMTEEDSAIIDYYPPEFDIDMNGKKMAWQGVALLPFIDEKRLLSALGDRYPMLTEDEVRRNGFGNNTLFISEDSKLYDLCSALYIKRTSDEPVPMDPKLSGGITGTIKPDPVCVPGSTFNSPLTSQNLHDIFNDRSLSVLYDFPEQRTPHRSVLLKGLKPPKRVLTTGDIDWVKRGGPDSRGRGRGRGRGGPPRGGRDGHSSLKDLVRVGNGPMGSHSRYDGQGGLVGGQSGYGNYGGYGGNGGWDNGAAAAHGGGGGGYDPYGGYGNGGGYGGAAGGGGCE